MERSLYVIATSGGGGCGCGYRRSLCNSATDSVQPVSLQVGMHRHTHTHTHPQTHCIIINAMHSKTVVIPPKFKYTLDNTQIQSTTYKSRNDKKTTRILDKSLSNPRT